MKTTLEIKKAAPVAPIKYPALLSYSEDDIITHIILADTAKTGTVIFSTKGLDVGFSWHTFTGKDFTDGSWKPIATPVTITFDPTK